MYKRTANMQATRAQETKGLVETKEVIIYPVWNETNVYLTKEGIRKILKKGGILVDDIKHLDIFQEAFIHESYCTKSDFAKYEKYHGRLEGVAPEGVLPLQEKTGERLEWLGDGILQSVMANYLFKRYEDQQEGFLTKLRSKLVKTDTLAKLSRQIGLHKWIIMSKQKEIIGNGRRDERVLEDAFEALIGAISLEFGSEDEIEGIRVCRSFILKLYEENIDFAELIKKEDNYKDQLMQYYHKIYKDTKYLPVYEVKNIEMVENDNGMTVRRYNIIVRNQAGEIVGEGCSLMKKAAEVNAAKAALCFYGVVDGI